jgi:glycosyltransferase involved in cell wall biosynthesis
LEALSILRQQSFDIRLRAVGGFADPTYERRVRDFAGQLEIESRTEWVGFQSDINTQLRQMDLFMLPSLFGEGLPMVVLEAMAMGVPVIATDVEGVPEAVRDGFEGRIVPPNDPQALATAVAELIRGSRDWRALRQNAISRQIAHFSDVSMAAGVARVYDEVLQPASSPA